MKVLKSLLILSIVILGFSYVNAEARSFSESDDVSNQRIERKVYSEILKLPFYGIFDIIRFQVNNGTVTLSGKVINAINRKSAEKRIIRLAGVNNVVNNIEVLPLSRFDNSIRRRTLRTITSRGNLFRYFLGSNSAIKIIVDRGHVSLEGFVRTKGDSRLANLLANSVSGTFSVNNNLVVTKDLES